MKLNKSNCFKACKHKLNNQCDLQVGDSEDISENEMKLECLRYWNICPYSMFTFKENNTTESEE